MMTETQAYGCGDRYMATGTETHRHGNRDTEMWSQGQRLRDMTTETRRYGDRNRAMVIGTEALRYNGRNLDRQR